MAKSLFFVLTIGGCLLSPAAWSLNIVVDYTYDTSDFFGAGNPDGAAAGAQARAAMEAGAAFFSAAIDDTLSPLATPEPYISSASGGADAVSTWSYQAFFNHPTTGGQVTLDNPSFAADEYRIYVGASFIAGSTIGIGGPGGYQSSSSFSYYFSWQLDEINAINDQFSRELENRDQPEGQFGRWGGAVTFDNSANWHFDHTSLPTGNDNDFYSTVIHEVAHAIGFGTATEWSDLLSGGVFFGDASIAANGGAPPAASSGHWAPGTMSTVFGSGETQAAAMNPSGISGNRYNFTTLDFAGLADIGWTILEPAGQPGDFNNDGLVNLADYTVWRNNLGATESDTILSGNGTGGTVDADDYELWKTYFGESTSASIQTVAAVPEPSTLLLVLLGAVGLVARVR